MKKLQLASLTLAALLLAGCGASAASTAESTSEAVSTEETAPAATAAPAPAVTKAQAPAAALTVADGIMTATIVWSSPNYDYMLVDGEKYLPVNTDGNSMFEIPVAALDTALAVTADTVAMSTPHEIDYTLTFDSATLAAAE